MTLQEFLSFVSGGQFHGALRMDGWRDPTRWRIVGRLLHEPFGWVGLALASLGVVYLAIRRRHILALTGVTFLAFFVYGLDYYVADIAVFLLPAHLILAIWMGLGVVALAEMLSVVGGVVRGTQGPSIAGIAQLMLVVLFAWVPLSGIWANLPAVDRRGDRGGYAWGQYALQQPLAEGGAVLADTKKFAPLYYLQQVEGVRPDLDMVLLGTEQLYRAELRRRLGEGETVYLARYLPNLDGLYLRSVGPLVEVATSHGQARQDFVSEPRDEGSVRLLDADIEVDPLGRALYHVTLHWQAEASLAGDFVVRLRLIDGDGRQRWASDGVRPVNGLYPTNAWPPGVPISDYHQLTVPAWLAPGTYELQAGLFSPFGEGGLRLEGASTPWIPLGTLNVEPPSDPEPLPYQRLFQVGDEAWLTGAGVPREGTAGAPLTVDLAWRGIVGDERVELWWGEAEGEVSLRRDDLTVLDSLARGMLRSRHTVTAPDENGLYTLYVGLVGKPVRCGWLARPRRGCRLADVRMLAGTEGLANFGDRVVLLEATVGKDAARPGQLIPVALRWRGIRTMAVDYTVFVHLVGPDGRLHGQVDSWPVQGSYPTSQWRPGTAIGDNYEVRLEPDAPLGSYQVQVGLYDLETMERLPVLGAAGEPVGDSYLVGTLDVSD
ncbi:MAG: hypothetical protein KGY78_09685, partial [Anaerolineae bacterium]|nr:hypothetical protein [Anaerolineae bacterium]